MDYNELNKEQLEAVKSDSPRILCLAGAGAGKTKTMVTRVARLIEDGVDPENILMLTFTRAAAMEQKERLISLIGEPGEKVKAFTFHSWAAYEIRRFGMKLGYDSGFSIYDQEDTESIVTAIIEELQYKARPKDVMDAMAKNHVYNVPIPDGDIGKIVTEYKFRCRRQNAVDIDSLISTLQTLLNDPTINEIKRNECKYVFVDEMQDTDQRQMRILDTLNPENLFVVGDDFQCWDGDGTVITEGGNKKVKDLRCGDRVQTITKGKIDYCPITNMSKHKAPTVIITTESGKKISVTRKHKMFATMPDLKSAYYVYIIYQKNKGFRIGMTHGGIDGIIGARTHSERPERLWFISRHESKAEAHYMESYISLKYRIPQLPFFHNGRGLSMTQDLMDSIFDSFGRNGYELLEDLQMSFEYPNFIRNNEDKRSVNLVMDSAHRTNMVTYESGEERIRKTFRNYKKARTMAEKIAVEKDVILKERLFIKDRVFLNVVPASQLSKTMQVPIIQNDGTIKLEPIISIDEGEITDVYHAEVEETGIMIVDGIASHNCIYSFRGSDVGIIMGLAENPDWQTIKLEENYRSTRQIIEPANTLIKHNNQTDKKLKAHREGPEITLITKPTIEEELEWIANKCIRLYTDDGYYGNTAILARTNKQVNAIAEKLAERDIPHEIRRKTADVLNTIEARKMFAYMQAVINPLDNEAVSAIINWPEQILTRREMLDVEMYQLEQDCSLMTALEVTEKAPELVSRIKSLREDVPETAYELFTMIVDITRIVGSNEAKGLDSRNHRIIELEEIIAKWAEDNENDSPEDWLEFYKMRMIEPAEPEERTDAIQLMTIHGSKGLEYNNVIIQGLNEKSLPLNRADIEEERRLMYVAITRAKTRLYLTRCELRTVWGDHQEESEPSRFTLEMVK